LRCPVAAVQTNPVKIGPASALARVAELRKRATVSPEEPWVSRGPRADSWPVSCERFSFDSKMVGIAIWGFRDERDPARVRER
jgi:hypothetical protein